MKALLLLGCPETPAQTPLAVYASYQLTEMGYDVTIAANPAATKLVRVSDPEKHYVHKMIDIDKSLSKLEEGQYDLLVGFVHKDAAASYFVTFSQILQTKSIALVFERDADLVEEYADMVSQNTDAEVVAVRAFHNPTPIKVRLDKVLKEL
ncbi:DUF1890 domain-containing protein [Methanobrevibacter oralis]|uniref:DUF1890 domain-containing protein n=1 Tax=Methanobrevibacter oralis TaxID=66851 RepID=A0A166BZ89_METOA|nr:DUF1890 domain-containing protein [Methanobrevibacter oralis]KZX13966.1 hypothetical protein MBORA_02060 [Methanobrevibacter oralis]